MKQEKSTIFVPTVLFKRATMDSNSIRFNHDNRVEISVSLIVFKEGELVIAYCPSLDLSGYDHTEEEALADFDFMLSDYLDTQLRQGTLRDDLVTHGWVIENDSLAEPSFSDMMEINQQLRRLLTMPYHKKVVNKTCPIPA